MGCIPTKNRKQDQFQIPRQSLDPEIEAKKEFAFNRVDTCSTMATFSAATSTRSRLFRRSSLKFGDKIAFSQYISMIINDLSSNQSQFAYKIVLPWDINNPILISCSPESIPFYLQILHGYAYQNISLTQPTYRRPPPKITLNSQTPTNEYKLILKQNISIFIKLLLQCQKCYKLTTITQSCTIFDLNYCNCQCNYQYLRVCVLKQQPSHLMIWSDDVGQMVLMGENVTQVLRRMGKVRVIGCTSCWGFGGLRKRVNCACAVCEKCIGSQCEICLK